MSSILKSLKKLEEEKASQKQGGSDVSRDILQGEMPKRKGQSGPSWFLLLLLLVIVGVGGAMLLRSEAPPPVVQTAPAPAPPSEPPVQAQPEAGAGEKVTTAAAQEVVAASKETAAALKSTAAALQDTAAALKAKAAVPQAAVAAQGVSKPKKAVKPTADKAPDKAAAAVEQESKIDLSKAFPAPPPKIKPVPVPAEARTSVWSLANRKGVPKPVLKVSEIHWRSDVKERLAVVNDLPVMEGVVIDGAKVDRIFKDRIRFVVNGQYQEVLLSPAP